MSTVPQDLRLGARLLAKNLGVNLIAVLTLALGIGANTAIFSVINALLLHPAGMQDPDRILAIRVRYDKLNLKSIPISAPDFVQIRDSKDIFSSAAMANMTDFSYSTGDFPEQLTGAPVTWQWFEVFGVKPRLGRAFNPEEDQPAANRVAILADGTWRRLFGGDPEIVGKTIRLNQLSYKVVGVMPPEFNWPPQTQLWVPLGLPASDYAAENMFDESYFVAARIRQDVKPAQAISYVPLAARRMSDQDPRATAYARDSQWGMFALPLTEFAYGDLKTPLLILLGGVAFVLLIGCANIAGLLLARASARAGEMAVRSALGASRWQLIRQTLVESSLLGLLGALSGLAAALGGIRVLLWLAPENVSAGLSIRPDGYVLLFTAIISVFASLFFGIIPAWQASWARQSFLLKEGGRSGTVSRSRQRIRSSLVVGEVALALVLLVGAGLFLRSLARLQRVGPGFDPGGVMTAAIALPDSQYPEEKRLAFYQTLVERLQAIPGVSAAAAAAPLPFSGSASSASFNIEGRPVGPGDPGPHSDLRWISPGYFTAMGIPLRSGRAFNDQDRRGTQPVAIIDENLAQQYWPNQDPIGRRLRRGSEDPWWTIVGVAGHVMHSTLAGDSVKGVCYYPVFQQPVQPGTYLVLKTSGDPARLAFAIRQAASSIDPAMPVSNLKTMEERLADSLAPRRFAVTLLGFFAAVAILMAAIGLYGVISYSVTLRTQEIGIRMALGAQTSQVLSMVLGHGMRLAAIGTAIGLFGAWILARSLSSQLFEVGAFDPVIFLLMAIVLGIVAAMAAYIPAHRAARVDPMDSLRYE